jgi:hypothetical protein
MKPYNIEPYEVGLTDEEKKDLACVRAAKSGEMHNMFAVCRKYGMTTKEFDKRLAEIRKDPVYREKLRNLADKQMGNSV